MAKQTINLGTAPSGVGGDTPRSAFLKAQGNFDEIYASFYQRANVLGLVSQSGGVPTGALMEYGSNAAGEYWKFANGLMLTSGYIQLGAQGWTAGVGVRYTDVLVGLPAVFVAAPLLYAQMRDGNVSARSAWCTLAVAPSPNTANLYFAATGNSTGASAIGVNVLAFGRWF